MHGLADRPPMSRVRALAWLLLTAAVPAIGQVAARGDAPVEVQVFGLVGSERVSVLCPGRAIRASEERIEELASGWQPLRSALGVPVQNDSS